MPRNFWLIDAPIALEFPRLGVSSVTCTGRRAMRGIQAGAAVGASIALVMAGAAPAAAKTKRQGSAQTVEQVIKSQSGSVQLVSFPDTGWGAVKVVRGGSSTKNQSRPTPNAEKAEAAEIIAFADPAAKPVRVIRGDSVVTPGQVRPANVMNMQVVSFANSGNRSVTIFRGASSYVADAGLFAPASAADLDRVAFAVDGAESSHGLDLRMWSLESSGPQGPMQITQAAATASTLLKTAHWAAPISHACSDDMAIGRTRSPPTTGGPATSMPGSAGDGRRTNFRWRSSAIASMCYATSRSAGRAP